MSPWKYINQDNEDALVCSSTASPQKPDHDMKFHCYNSLQESHFPESQYEQSHTGVHIPPHPFTHTHTYCTPSEPSTTNFHAWEWEANSKVLIHIAAGNDNGINLFRTRRKCHAVRKSEKTKETFHTYFHTYSCMYNLRNIQCKGITEILNKTPGHYKKMFYNSS